MSDSKKRKPRTGLTADQVNATLTKLADQYGLTSTKFRGESLHALKYLIAQDRAAAEEQLQRDGAGTKCAKHLSHSQDELIRALYDFSTAHLYPAVNPSTSERVGVVAVGGYGRGTLAQGFSHRP